MKKLSILMFIFVLASSVSAQSTSTAPFEQRKIKLEERQEERQIKLQEIQTEREERKSELEAKRAERKIKLQEEKKERIKKITSNIAEKLDNSIIRLENFAIKIQEKIEKFDQREIDTTEAKRLLEIANQKLEDAKTEILNAKTDVETLLVGEEVSINDFKNIFESARLSIKEARQAYVDVVNSLKAAIENKKQEDNNENN